MVTARPAAAGFTYLGILFALTIGAVAADAALVLWTVEERRARELTLLFVGNQYRQAIASYCESDPGVGNGEPAGAYPPSLDALLEDRRGVGMRRHLRRPYRDPVSGGPWILVRSADGGIAGVRSASLLAPLQWANFSEENADFTGKTRYADWTFLYSAQRRRDLPAVMLPPRGQ